MDFITAAIARKYTDTRFEELGFDNLTYHFCLSGEYNSSTGVPTVESPDENTMYFTPGDENVFNVYIYNNGWELFTSVELDLSTIPTDDTLAVAGTAADAKAVGDELYDVKSDLRDLDDIVESLSESLSTNNITDGYMNTNGRVDTSIPSCTGRLYKYALPDGVSKIYISGTETFDPDGNWCALWFVKNNAMMPNGYVPVVQNPQEWDMFELQVPTGTEEIWADLKIKVFTSNTVSENIAKRVSTLESEYDEVNAQTLPSGGTSGQVLTKNSNTDYDVKWSASPVEAIEDTLRDYLITDNVNDGFLQSNGYVNTNYSSSYGRLYKYNIPSGLTKIYISGTTAFTVTNPYWCVLWFVNNGSMITDGYIPITVSPYTWNMFEVAVPENTEEIWADKVLKIYTQNEVDPDITGRICAVENSVVSQKEKIESIVKGTGDVVLSYTDFTSTTSSTTYTVDETNETITVTASGEYKRASVPNALFASSIKIGKRYRFHAKARRISGNSPIIIAVSGTKTNSNQIAKRIEIQNNGDAYFDFVTDQYMKHIDLFVTFGTVSSRSSIEFSDVWVKEFETSSDIGSQWLGKKWYAYGTSITNISSEGRYPNYLKRMAGLVLVNKGISGGGIGNLGAYSTGQVYNAICSTTDGKTEADLITLETGANDCNANVPLGTIYDTGTSTLAGCLNDCIRYLQANTNAQICIINSPATTTEPTASNKYYEWADMVEKICHINRVYFIRNDNNMGYAKVADSSKGSMYVVDVIHQTNLGGFIMAQNIWYQLRNIPCFYTEMPDY